jgi:hypothetical protein
MLPFLDLAMVRAAMSVELRDLTRVSCRFPRRYRSRYRGRLGHKTMRGWTLLSPSDVTEIFKPHEVDIDSAAVGGISLPPRHEGTWMH